MKFCSVGLSGWGMPKSCWLVAAFSLNVLAQDGLAQDIVRAGKADFVLTDIRYSLAEDAVVTGACPNGMSLNSAEIFTLNPDGARRSNESDADYGKRRYMGAKKLSQSAEGESYCQHPELAPPVEYVRSVDIDTVPVSGIDLDNQHTRRDSTAGSCPHADFYGLNGETGVDNQFYRAVGCNRSYQSTGQSNGFAIGMLTGSWGVLLSLEDVDDIVDDYHVVVGIYANADPIQLSAHRQPLPYATYTIDPDPRHQATTTGRIEGGVLTTEPVDILLRNEVNSMYLERPLRAARIQATLSSQGELRGYLSGYTPVEAMYDLNFSYRNGRTVNGELSPLALRVQSAHGAAFVLGYTCSGMYQSLNRLADGHPDPETGKCTSISTQHQFEAIPAFVVNATVQTPNVTAAEGEEVAHAK